MATSFDKAPKPDKSGKAGKAGRSDGSGASTRATKAERSSRRAVADDVRRKQARRERGKSFMIVGVCALVALVIVGAAAYAPIRDWWELRQFRDVELSAIGAPASACGEPTTKPASGVQDHVPAGTQVDYPDAPPAFGQHYDTPATMERKFYEADDRPELETLVHNMEHGYSLLWYDETVAADAEQMDQLRGIADKLAGTGNQRLKFKAVPWTSEDGDAFADGQHIAMTHWTARGVGDNEDAQTALGVTQYCTGVSGEGLEQFMLDYPYTNSPEPNGV